jgi:sucrose phosphorylase|tara:strand:- start:13114 stop:14835 length:1722 start_codon:yes stop_codon:yes gene_type:complete
MSPLDHLNLRIETHLAAIYGEGDHSVLVGRLIDSMRLHEHFFEPVPFTNHWSEKDIALITYGDSIIPKEGTPLEELASFVSERLGDSVSIVHVLPYFPWTSDDGFAVANYDQVNSDLGDWADLENLSQDYRIMSDLVMNHCSTSHEWFQQFEKNEEPGCRFFVKASPLDDLSEVVRPRTSPLLRPTETASGRKHVWCTFGHDQVDFNFRDHDLLVEFVKIIRTHLDHGISVFRLDAVAFVWKEPGTECINLPQTHELVRLFRTLIEHVKPDAVIITETNIPNQENLSYFGNGNEAHGIYNFSLPPLLLYSLTYGDCRSLIQWLMRMPPAQPGTMYFNFIASHDGIGLRPAEGLLSHEEIQSMVGKMVEYGGLISERALPGGGKRSYEINISLFDALQTEEKFLCAHTILLGLEGVPAFYIHSLLGTRNDRERAISSGISRRINRHQWDADELRIELDNEKSPHASVLKKLRERIDLRREQAAFHPNATQFTLHMGDQVFSFWRQSVDRRSNIFCLNNVSGEEQRIPVAAINLISTEEWLDLISGDILEDEEGDVVLAPYQCIWLANRRKHLPY